ncbi:hypothetical protein ACG2F4_14850 [Halalkalibaculum sp. DA3122]|uniref:hypothetical protein n=1 Tax=Halalkalibaculum sp. DA3122 TaxID=3373607 RepID=UPI00375509A2
MTAQQERPGPVLGTSATGFKEHIAHHIAEIKRGIHDSRGWKDFTMTGQHPAIGRLNQLVDSHNISTIRQPGPIYLLRQADETYRVQDL